MFFTHPYRLVAVAGLLVVSLLFAGCAQRDSRIDTHLRLAAKSLSHQKPLKARGEIDAAISLDPSRSDTYRTAAAIYYDRKRFADAAPLLERFLERAAAGKLDKRLTDYDRAQLLVALGQARQEANDPAGADEAFHDALGLDPSNPQLMNDVAYLYAEKGVRLREALSLARRAVARMPEDGNVVDTLGWAEYKSGCHATAARTLARAVRLMPDKAALRYHLGAVYAKLGRTDEARIELGKALLLDDTMKDAADLLRDIHN